MAEDKDTSGKLTIMLAQESLAGVERMKPTEAGLASVQGVENLKPQELQLSLGTNSPQPQEKEKIPAPIDTTTPGRTLAPHDLGIGGGKSHALLTQTGNKRI
jgi:hypothetical protein